jgi:hypothetical protein
MLPVLVVSCQQDGAAVVEACQVAGLEEEGLHDYRAACCWLVIVEGCLIHARVLFHEEEEEEEEECCSMGFDMWFTEKALKYCCTPLCASVQPL